MPKNIREKLIEIINDPELDDYFDIVEKNSKEVYRYFNNEKSRKSLDEVIDLFVNIYNKLTEQVKKIKF